MKARCDPQLPARETGFGRKGLTRRDGSIEAPVAGIGPVAHPIAGRCHHIQAQGERKVGGRRTVGKIDIDPNCQGDLVSKSLPNNEKNDADVLVERLSGRVMDRKAGSEGGKGMGISMSQAKMQGSHRSRSRPCHSRRRPML